MLVVAIASISVGTAVTALAVEGADTTTSSTASAHHRTHPVLGPMPSSLLVATTLRATKQLNLTAAQQSQIRTILQNAHTQAKANAQANSVDIAVLGNPSDPNYATALQTFKTNTTNRIQEESNLQGQIINVLTPEQKEKLPTVLASIKARRTAAAEQHHTGSMR